jgi:hypothetical protein
MLGAKGRRYWELKEEADDRKDRNNCFHINMKNECM